MIDIMNDRRQASPAGGGTFRDWALGSDREARLPECFFEKISLASVNRAVRILASSRATAERTLFDIHQRPVTAEPRIGTMEKLGDLYGKLDGTAATRPTVDHAASGTTSLAAAQQVAPGSSSRGHELIKQALLKQFLVAPVSSVLPGLRIRSSAKGAHAGLSELPLLFEVQSCALLAVIVRGSQLSRKFFLRKMVLSGLSVEKKLEASKYLSNMGLTLDQYSANAKVSSHDADLDSIGPHYPAGPLPYGLARSDIPTILRVRWKRRLGQARRLLRQCLFPSSNLHPQRNNATSQWMTAARAATMKTRRTAPTCTSALATTRNETGRKQLILIIVKYDI